MNNLRKVYNKILYREVSRMILEFEMEMRSNAEGKSESLLAMPVTYNILIVKNSIDDVSYVIDERSSPSWKLFMTIV